jgi:hypothetical protein
MLKRLRADARLFPSAGFFLKFQANWLLAGRRFGARRHAASGVVVSLTSYPPRFGTLHLTLMRLLPDLRAGAHRPVDRPPGHGQAARQRDVIDPLWPGDPPATTCAPTRS